MPFDSKDFVETKPDVFSLEGLIAWLETQDPATRYDYGDVVLCALGQYTLAQGGSIIGGVRGYVIGEQSIPCTFSDGLPDRLWKTVSENPHTYGAALERARMLTTS